MMSSGEVTVLLGRIEAGEDGARDRLLTLVYDELRALARSRMRALAPGQTLQPTALVHEAYLKLLGESDGGAAFKDRAHFFGAAARAMRNVLVDAARRRSRSKRGGDRRREAIPEDELPFEHDPDELLALDEALRALEADDKARYDVVMLRYFAGLSVDETARVLDIAPATVDRRWSVARAWLRRRMSGGPA